MGFDFKLTSTHDNPTIRAKYECSDGYLKYRWMDIDFLEIFDCMPPPMLPTVCFYSESKFWSHSEMRELYDCLEGLQSYNESDTLKIMIADFKQFIEDQCTMSTC